MENRFKVVSIIWVPKGASKENPKEYDLDDGSFKELKVKLDKEKIINDKEIEDDDDEEILSGLNEIGNKKDMELIESNYEKVVNDEVEFREKEKKTILLRKQTL